MGQREVSVCKSILRAIFHDYKDKRTLLLRIFAFFTFFQIRLARYREELFKKLRTDIWGLDENEYRESFRSHERKGKLKAMGDLGYSGSTFFSTPNSKFLIKSLPRRSEYTFFCRDLLQPYFDHMVENPNCLLVRITDLLYSPFVTLGGILGLAPPCHIVMENILYGKESDSEGDKWETYDLKPISYFYPERDIAGGNLAPDSVKERLFDKFEDTIRVTENDRIMLLQTLQKDTKILEECNAVDYSLFVVRYPPPTEGHVRHIPSLKSHCSQWRSGVPSVDGKWIYKVVVLDFFWAKHKFQAKAMTGLISAFNLISRKGHMSITTDPDEYRERFLRMVDSLVESDQTTGVAETTSRIPSTTE
ncbi:SAICAR synthase-like protein [Trichodelitschia bisporula]|uniref:SAICAR synthase-like protein n=1 Tax=Trichodelitschia bisporula TaxID=703511 RepID=A0A6G1I889_9PEZI|nr:SAICAR synthase-like protein [Trichodelitschia bisporula]